MGFHQECNAVVPVTPQALLGQNRVTDAKLVFSKVREMSVTEIPPVCLNLAFCHMALGEHVQSVQVSGFLVQ